MLFSTSRAQSLRLAFPLFLLVGTICICGCIPNHKKVTIEEEADEIALDAPQMIDVLVIRGGHAYDTPEFEEMCLELEGVRADLVLTDHFERMTESDIDEKYDAILFLNQNKKYRTPERHRQRYLELAKRGVGMVFLHFTLSSEPEWDEYHDLVGGKWYLKKFEKNAELHSTYFTEMTLNVHVVNAKHPVTNGMNDFELNDAFYGNITMADSVIPLLTVDHPDVAETIAWAHRFKNSRIVYLMPGFTKNAYQNDGYRKFVSNALHYVACSSEPSAAVD